jgi:hypothetical protein
MWKSAPSAVQPGVLQLEGGAAGAGKAEVRDRLAEHFQSFLCLF